MEAPTSTVKKDHAEEDPTQSILTTLPPSHIQQDCTFVHLPPPSTAERVRFFERSIAKHGLLVDDLKDSQEQPVQEESEEKQDKTEPKLHPLALASSRLQDNGISSLNRSINLHGLVATNEYFGVANIVDPSLEQRVTENERPSSAAAPPISSSLEERRNKATFVLSRKRAQFTQAAVTLKRHKSRLLQVAASQRQPDQRLRKLRPQWRLVAPEHGTRALPHPPRPTEAVVIDTDVYYNQIVSGRLAKGVPRYATIELKDSYSVEEDTNVWKKEWLDPLLTSAERDDSSNPDSQDSSGKDEPMPDAQESKKPPAKRETESGWTRAEPFAMADPALGNREFDPSSVTMLTLQFDVEKPSTGFCQSASLEPMSNYSAQSKKEGKATVEMQQDEKLLLSLQHSLFCAKLFESIRRELAPDTEDIGKLRTTAKAQSAVWLSGESDENFLPPPSQMIGGSSDEEARGDLVALSVVHVHEGDLKVLLDCEYSLRIRLVEPSQQDNQSRGTTIKSTDESSDSGTHSSSRLLGVCKALLLYAQEIHHRHSVESEALLRNQQQKDGQPGQFKKRDKLPSPRILQSCVSLGTKMLFERRIRLVLCNVRDWVATQKQLKDGKLAVEWLSLSVFDLSSQFHVSFGSWSIDANIVCDQIVVTRFGANGDYRKAKFYTDRDFELFLKTSLQKL